jgi:hypothetical protein
LGYVFHKKIVLAVYLCGNTVLTFKNDDFPKHQQDRQCMYAVTQRSHRITIVAVEKQQLLRISVHACVCVCVLLGAWARVCRCTRVALVMQHATRGHTVICGLSCSTTLFDINF